MSKQFWKCSILILVLHISSKAGSTLEDFYNYQVNYVPGVINSYLGHWYSWSTEGAYASPDLEFNSEFIGEIEGTLYKPQDQAESYPGAGNAIFPESWFGFWFTQGEDPIATLNSMDGVIIYFRDSWANAIDDGSARIMLSLDAANNFSTEWRCPIEGASPKVCRWSDFRQDTNIPAIDKEFAIPFNKIVGMKIALQSSSEAYGAITLIQIDWIETTPLPVYFQHSKPSFSNPPLIIEYRVNGVRIKESNR
jgi:hypothetical protein